jgi:Na+:H+ antiporter, NhaA family
MKKRRRVPSLFLEFIGGERLGGLVLIVCSLVSLLSSNLPFGNAYVAFWHHSLDLSFLRLHLTIAEWVNDGLMTVFFLLVGLEIKRELYKGELSSPRKALLPVVAAAGGMIIPGLIHFLINRGTSTQAGFGIPVATDIAFALGVLSFLGHRVPLPLKVLLTALAIIDDLGAILVIVIFYSRGLSLFHLLGAALTFAVMVALNKAKVNSLIVYSCLGIVMWLFTIKSGVHPTIAGVLLAFAVPFREGGKMSPSARMERVLDRPVPLLILPLYALANMAMAISPGWYLALTGANQLGIMAGLVIGKPVGIVLAIFLAVKMGLSDLPAIINWRHVAAMGVLCGIGFTMSIFITNLAFSNSMLVQESKIAILLASMTAGVAGLLILSAAVRKSP